MTCWGIPSTRRTAWPSSCGCATTRPETGLRATGFLVAKDFLTLRLTGRRCIDPSDAAGTNAWDQVAGAWSAEMLRAAGIEAWLFPEVLPSASVAGGCALMRRRACGLHPGTPVVVGGGDGACAALGPGLIPGTRPPTPRSGRRPGSPSSRSAPLRDPQRRVVTFDHVIPGHFAPLGAMQAAGTALEWVASTSAARDRAASARSSRRPAMSRQPAKGSSSCPTCSGERAPIWDTERARHVRGPGAPPSARAPHARLPGGCRLQPLRHLPGAIRDRRGPSRPSTPSAAALAATSGCASWPTRGACQCAAATSWTRPTRWARLSSAASRSGSSRTGPQRRRCRRSRLSFEPDPARHDQASRRPRALQRRRTAAAHVVPSASSVRQLVQACPTLTTGFSRTPSAVDLDAHAVPGADASTSAAGTMPVPVSRTAPTGKDRPGRAMRRGRRSVGAGAPCSCRPRRWWLRRAG